LTADGWQMETWTIAQWCRECGGDRHEFTRKVSAADIKPVAKAEGRAKGADLYRVRDLLKATLGGDHEAEKLRKTREEADRLALANARSRGELVEIAAVKKLGEKVMIALRNRVLNMPLTDEEKDRCLIELMELGKLDWSREA
jgi:phage terminase Nu1 subunit (DNA packaging protein)